MRSIFHLIAVIFLVGALGACSSKPKSADPDERGAARPAPPQEAPAKSDEAEEAIEHPPSTVQRGLDKRYEALGRAVRVAGKASAIEDEAARILGVNAHDPIALNALALLNLRRGKPGAAKLLLSKALEKNAPTASLHNNLGVAFMDEGDQEAAIVEFKKALQLDDRHAEALGNLGSLYAKSGDFERAFPYLESSYKANRLNVAVANNYALALRERKDYEGARRVYLESLQAHPKDVPTLLNYAILLIDFMNRPKDGLDAVFKLKFQETQRKDVLARANALEKKAKSELK